MHVDFAADRRLHHRDRNAAEKIGAIALEEGMRFGRDENIEIARRTASRAGLSLAAEPDAGAVLDSRGDIDRKAALARDLAGSTAWGARIVDDIASPMAMGTGPFDREESLLRPHAPVAAAGRTSARLGPRLGAGPGTNLAGDRRRQSQRRDLAVER